MKLRYDRKGIKIYNSDNLDLLKSLESDSVELIYCDILYNSGKEFEDYNDNLGSPKEAVEWYRPRIEEMFRVLSKTGSIYIHCNWRLDSYIRVLMDEIFGVECFRNRIYRKHSNKRGFVNNYDSQMDIILYYTKDRYEFTFNEIVGDKLNIFPLFEIGEVTGGMSNFILDRDGVYFNPRDYKVHWLVDKDTLHSLVDKKEVVLIDNKPYRKSYYTPIGNLWEEEDMLDNYSRTLKVEAYDTPKPQSVLERIIKISSNEGDTVADFFLGGGGTAVATRNLNRKGIFCDISEKACDKTIRRLLDTRDENENFNHRS